MILTTGPQVFKLLEPAPKNLDSLTTILAVNEYGEEGYLLLQHCSTEAMLRSQGYHPENYWVISCYYSGIGSIFTMPACYLMGMAYVQFRGRTLTTYAEMIGNEPDFALPHIPDAMDERNCLDIYDLQVPRHDCSSESLQRAVAAMQRAFLGLRRAGLPARMALLELLRTAPEHLAEYLPFIGYALYKMAHPNETYYLYYDVSTWFSANFGSETLYF